MTVTATIPAVERKLSVRLARDNADIEAAQRLRWDVFYQERGAHAETADQVRGIDADPFDGVCDHLLVEDQAGAAPRLVGTYRLLRQSVAAGRGGFYSAGEYDIDAVTGAGGEALELGRSCVAPAYRDAGTIQMLWRGIASYLQRYSVSTLFGCASFHGVDPDEHADTLSYLAHNHLAPADLRVRALDARYVEMSRLPIGGYDARAAMRKLPPLIKGYLRVGAMVGEGAVIDHQFNTIDIFMVMPVERIGARYLGRFGAAA
jgi:putative hemolysin